MIQGQHGVGLATAEVRMEVNNWIASFACKAADGPTNSPFRLSVRYVRRKNSTGSRYSSVPSPRCTCQRSAANSACW